jgi:DedD protein
MQSTQSAFLALSAVSAASAYVKIGALAAQSRDDGFHEIQLNGKQLVFLFMAATVVSVVIFLCGVLVGRGVRAEQAAAQEAALNTSAADATTPQTAATSTPAPAPAGSDPTAAAPPPAVDDLTYFNRLEKQKSPAEQLKAKPTATTMSEKTTPSEARPPAPVPPAAPAKARDVASGSPGWTVQIAALNERNAAEAIARRLSSKGYAAYVFDPLDGTSVYRVRVGKFGTRHEAENLKTRLEKEEQFKPFVTR